MLVDAKGHVRATLDLMRDDGGPSLTLFDPTTRRRVILGATILREAVKTGGTRTRPESSLVLVDNDGKVVLQAP